MVRCYAGNRKESSSVTVNKEEDLFSPKLMKVIGTKQLYITFAGLDVIVLFQNLILLGTFY